MEEKFTVKITMNAITMNNGRMKIFDAEHQYVMSQVLQE